MFQYFRESTRFLSASNHRHHISRDEIEFAEGGRNLLPLTDAILKKNPQLGVVHIAGYFPADSHDINE